MRKELPKILITGGAGFIGSTFVRLLTAKKYKTIVVDKLTYAADLKRLSSVKGYYKFYKADISDKDKIDSIIKKDSPEIVVNFSAESHVDRSILDSSVFLKTNLIGTQVLLDASKKYKIKRFIHISTDEVYGDIIKGKFSEDSSLKPNSPYAASKAAADLLIRSYVRTFGLPAIIIRPSNNFGPWQYPEKLIPLSILRIFRNEKIPVYGDGRNVREWLYVEDCAEGILRILTEGENGEVYNLGSRDERQNLEVVKMILKILKRPDSMIEFVKDRPGHDIRYSLASSKVFKKTGWRPKLTFEDNLRTTVSWCFKHEGWLLSKWKSISSLYKK